MGFPLVLVSLGDNVTRESQGNYLPTGQFPDHFFGIPFAAALLAPAPLPEYQQQHFLAVLTSRVPNSPFQELVPQSSTALFSSRRTNIVHNPPALHTGQAVT